MVDDLFGFDVLCDEELFKIANEDIQNLKQIIEKHLLVDDADINTYTSPIDFLESLEAADTVCDIAFLDIDMPQMSGIELGKKIKKLFENTAIVFVTAFPQHAIDAYDCEAFHYLLKPLDEAKCESVLNRFIQKYISNNRYITVKLNQETVKIHINKIYYVEYVGRHVVYHLNDEKYDAVGKISDAYKELKDYGFLQVHQGYIVNMEKIKRFKDLSVLLDNGESVTISRRKRADALRAYARYLEAQRSWK